MADTLEAVQAASERAGLLLKTEQDTRALVELKNIDYVDAMEEFGQPIPRHQYPPFDTPGFRNRGIWALDADRKEGKYPPFFETEVELQNIRWFARWLRGEITIASGVLDRLRDYVIGSGFEYTVQFRKNVEPVAGLLAAVQFVVDEFIERTRWTEFQGHYHDASREDGEAMIHLQRDDWQTFPSLFPPEWVTQPASSQELEQWVGSRFGIEFDGFVPCWTFGILTPEHRTDKTIGYHIVRDVVGNDFDFYPASEVVHVKRNVPYGVKRGVTDFYPNRTLIEKTHKLSHRTVSGATAQASIAIVRQHVQGTPRSAVQSMLDSNRYASYQQPRPEDSTRTINAELYNGVQAIDIPSGAEYQAGPMGQSSAPVYIDVMQAGLRMVGVKWAFPEYMISGDASNANFASTLVSDGPFVKAREADQRFYVSADRDVLRKVINNAWAGGRFKEFNVTPDTLWLLIELNIEAPEVASRDKLELSQSQSLLIVAGIMSKRTAATQQGLDYDQEQENIKTEPKTPAPQAGQVPGVPAAGVPFGNQQPQVAESAGEDGRDGAAGKDGRDGRDAPVELIAEAAAGRVRDGIKQDMTESERLELARHLLWSDVEGNVYP